jgi:hypothetical protein
VASLLCLSLCDCEDKAEAMMPEHGAGGQSGALMQPLAGSDEDAEFGRRAMPPAIGDDEPGELLVQERDAHVPGGLGPDLRKLFEDNRESVTTYYIRGTYPAPFKQYFWKLGSEIADPLAQLTTLLCGVVAGTGVAHSSGPIVLLSAASLVSRGIAGYAVPKAQELANIMTCLKVLERSPELAPELLGVPARAQLDAAIEA